MRGRADDYVEIGLDTGVCYNPLHNDLDPYAVAYAIATLLNNLFGKSKEPFWQQAYTDLLKFVILLRRLTDGYTTFAEVYRYILDDTQIDRDIRRLKAALAEPPDVLLVPMEEYHLLRCAALVDALVRGRRGPHGAPVRRRTGDVPGRARRVATRCSAPQGTGWAARRHQLEALERWYVPRLESARCAAAVVHHRGRRRVPVAVRRQPGRAPRVLSAAERLHGHAGRRASRDRWSRSTSCSTTGRVLALNFPVAMNPGLARIIGVMLKLDFQRAVLQRIPKMSAQPDRVWRDLLFVCDEYHAFATVGETDPTGDERTFALSRQARLIPIVATQSISSLRSVLPGDESWRTLLQCFRNKVFLATSDEFTARNAAELCGRRDRLKAHYSLSESGQDAHVSLLTGRAAAAKAVDHREQELRADTRVHLRAARLHGAAERAGDRPAVRRRQPAAAAVLLSEAALPGRPDQLLRSPGAEVRCEQPGPHPAVPAADRGSAARSGRHRGDGELRRPARVRRARAARSRWCPTGRSKSGT